MSETICVLNAGGWGTALSVLLAGKGHEVRLWTRRPALAAALAESRENRDYLPGVPIPDGVAVTADLRGAVEGASIVLVAAISSYMSEMGKLLSPIISPGQLVVHGSKGLDPDSLRRGSEILEAGLGPRLTR